MIQELLYHYEENTERCESAGENRHGAGGESPLRRRCSEPLRPRVMRRLPVRGRRSVSAGIRRRGIELRNQPSGAPTLCTCGEGNTLCRDMRAVQRPTESETLCMRRSSMLGSRESLEATGGSPAASPAGKGLWPNARRARDQAVGQALVPEIPPNKGPQPAEPATDRRRWRREGGLTKGNTLQPSTPRTQSRRERYGEL